MEDLSEVYVGNFRPDITVPEIANLLFSMGFRNFAVNDLDISAFIGASAYCFVKFKDLVDAKYARYKLPGLPAQMHATPIFTVRKSMNFLENQQSPAQAILYGMKHDPNAANMICRIKITQCE